jgi:hypothetical protein
VVFLLPCLSQLFCQDKQTSQHWPTQFGNGQKSSKLSADVNYVIDGGSLLHHLLWPHDSTYNTVFSLGVQYVTRKYGQATIVFDGYEDGPSTKDCTHLRRAGAGSPTIKFEGHMVMSSKKQDFLANKTNKQRFINMFANKLLAARFFMQQETQTFS